MNTVCGKTITYLKDPGKIAKPHSLTGPAFIYSVEEGKAPEYYLYGIKYTKSKWQELVNQHNSYLISDESELEQDNEAIY